MARADRIARTGKKDIRPRFMKGIVANGESENDVF